MKVYFPRRDLLPSLILLAFLALIFFRPTTPVAAAPPNATNELSVTLESHLGGQVESLSIQGTYAYVGVGYELVVMDIARPGQPARVGGLLLPEEIRRIVTADGFAYVASESSMYVITLSNPAVPRLLSRYPLEEEALGLAVRLPYVYLAERAQGINILDLSDPHQPAKVGQYGQSTRVMRVVEDYLFYLTHYLDRPASQFHVVDLSDPVHPVEIGTVDVPISVQHLRVAGNHAYVAGWASTSGQSYRPSFGIIDISTPADPAIAVADYEVPGPLQSTVTALDVADRHAYIAVKSDLHIVEVSDSAVPTVVSSYQAASGISDARVLGAHLYLAQRGHGIEVVEIAAPEAPEGAALSRNLGEVAFVAAAEGALYTLNSDQYDSRSLRVVGLPDPAVVGIVEAGTPRALAVAEQRIYAAGYVADAQGGGGGTSSGSLLQIFDGSTPQSPELLGTYSGAERPADIAISGTYAYIAASSGLHIIDVSNPAAPAEVALYDPGPGALSIAVSNGLAYLGHYNDGTRALHILDVSDPTSPEPLSVYKIDGTIPGRFGPSDVLVRGDYAYLAMESGGLLVLDISDPQNPAVTTNYHVNDTDSDSSTVALAIDGDYAFLAEYEGGLRVLDISNPVEPVQLFHRDTLHRAVDIAADGRRVYVADERGGLLIFHYFEATSRTYLPLLTSPGRASFSTDTPH